MKKTEEVIQDVKTEEIKESKPVDPDWKDMYIRLYAEFDNYKKRMIKEKETLKEQTKIKMLEALLDIDSDIEYAMKSIKDEETLKGINLIISKLTLFLKSQGIESIQTKEYDENIHEVISLVETGKNEIVDVVSKGYLLNGAPIRYPKVILGK